jgi:hypothetical protein
MSFFLTLFLINTGCSGGKGGGDDTGANDDGIHLEIESPDRAAFIPSGEVSLTGSVFSYGSDVMVLEVNNEAVPVANNGNFSVQPSLATGLNIFATMAENEAGEFAIDGRSIYHGDQIDQGETVSDGAMILVTPSLLDDDEASLNDAASILEMAIEDSSFGELLIGQTVPTDYFDFTLTGFTVSEANIDLAPASGTVEGEISLSDIWISFDLDDILGIGLDSSGEAWATEANVNMSLDFEMYNGEIVTNSSNSDASLTGFGLTVEWVPDSIEGYLGDWLQEYVEDTVEDEINSKAGAMLADFLEGLAAGTEVAGVELDMSLTTIEIAPQGIRMIADVAAAGAPILPMPQNGGSPRTSGEAPSWSDLSDAPISLVLDDDIINQLLFGFWLGGAFEDYQFSGAEFDLLSGGPVYEPLGPIESVSVDFNLPVMLAPPVNSAMTADLGVGELVMNFLRTDGSEHNISVNAWLGAVLSLTESSSVDIDLDDSPDNLESAIGVVSTTSNESNYELASQLQSILPGMLGRAASLAPNIDIPSLPLGEKLGLESMEGLALVINNATVDVLDSGWTVLTSELEAETAE